MGNRLKERSVAICCEYCSKGRHGGSELDEHFQIRNYFLNQIFISTSKKLLLYKLWKQIVIPVYCVFLMGWLTKYRQKDIESVI